VEQGLCSKGSEFLALSRNFVCVRLYYTAKGASEPFARLGLGNPGGPRNNVDLAFLAPDGRNIDVRTLKPVQGPQDGVWVRDIVAGQKNEAGDGKQILEKTFELMKALTKQYPGKAAPAAVPGQVSLSHGVFVSAWDSRVARESGTRARRRMVIVPSGAEGVDPELDRLLNDADVLRRFERHYVFVRLTPEQTPPELQEPLSRAGQGGLAILDAAQSVNGFGQKQEVVSKVYPAVLDARTGPLTKPALVALLEKHGPRPEPAPRSGAR
jgi:hypothetical protein